MQVRSAPAAEGAGLMIKQSSIPPDPSITLRAMSEEVWRPASARRLATGLLRRMPVFSAALVAILLPGCAGKPSAPSAPVDFNLSVSPSAVTLQEGGTVEKIFVNASAVNGFSAPVNVALVGLPESVTSIPNVLTLMPGVPQEVTLRAPFGSTVGPYSVFVQGSSGQGSLGSLSHAAELALCITPAADFSLSVSPAAIRLQGGSSTSLSLSAAVLNGFSPVTVSLAGLPAGVTAVPSTMTLLPGKPQQVAIVASAIAPVGSATLQVQAVAGSITHTDEVPLSIWNEPTLALNVYPASFSLAPGLSQTITVSAVDEYALSPVITFSFTGLPPGITASPATLDLGPGASGQMVLTAGANFTQPGSAMFTAKVDDIEADQKVAFSALPAPPAGMVTNGLMAFFTNAELSGNTIHDVSGNGYTGSFGGAGNIWTPAGVSFNGNGWIDLPPDLNTAQTIQIWTEAPNTQANPFEVLLGTANGGSGNTIDWAIGNETLLLSTAASAGIRSASPFSGSATLSFVEGSSSLNTIDQYWIDGDQAQIREPSTSAVAGLAIAGHFQIAAAGGTYGLSGIVGPIAFYDRPLTPVEVSQNAAFFNQMEQSRGVATQQSNASSQNQFIAMGDSITFGLEASAPYCKVLVEPAFNSQCLGFIGQTSDLGVLQAPQFANYYDTQAKQNIFFDWYMSNDLANGVPIDQLLQNLQNTCSIIKQIYPGWKVLLGTMMSRVDVLESARAAVNDSIREQQHSTCDGFIDVAADPLLGANGAYAGGYFADGTHPNDLGQKEIASIVARYINSIAGSTAAAPTSQSQSKYAMTSADNYVQASAARDGTWTLPECIGLTGKDYQIVNQGTGSLTLTGANSEKIAGSTTIAPNASGTFLVSLLSDATGGCSWVRQ